MDTQQAYHDYLETTARRYERLCRRCGACCGAQEDPCEHLEEVSPARYRCAIYAHRQGAHHTRSGKQMRCVELRDMRHQDWPGGWKCSCLTK